jgi:energy-coupling factor transporter ATP-binding protein EcfA2
VIVQRIELKNFRSFQLAAFDFDQARTLLLGPNGAGKSTLVDAIAWALTGRCRGVDGAGRGQKELIRTGATDMGVDLHVQGLGLISRTLAKDGHAVCNLKTDAILAHLGVSEAMLHAVLYGGAFFAMNYADANAMLMALLDVRVDPAKLPGLGFKEPATLADLDAKYILATAERASLKKQLAAVTVPPLPMTMQYQDVGELLHDATTVYQQLARDQAQADQAIRTVTAKIDAVDKLVARGPDLAAQVTVHRGMLTDAAAKVTDAQQQLDAVEAEAADDPGTVQTQLDELKLLIERIQRHEPTRGCVLSAAIPCLTDAKHFTGQIATLKKDTKTLAGKIKAAQGRRDTLLKLQQLVRDAQQAVTYGQTQIANLERTLGEIDTAAATRPALVETLDAVTAQKAGAEDALQAAAQTMQDLQDQRQRQDQHLASSQAYQQAAAAKARLVADVAAAEAAVALLGPKGVRADALNDALDGFHAMVNASLEPFGFALAITPDPWRVQVLKAGDGQALRFDLLSAGEQLWTGAAFQIALAVASGLKFAVVDAAEAVVGTHRQQITAMVMGAPLMDQVIVAMARGDAEPAPAIPGLQVIRLEGTNRE